MPFALATRFGLDPLRLSFAARTALGACIALLVAWLLGLEHPQWSAMTVWAASQPTRGLLLEKSLFRMIGTAAGVAFGVLLVGFFGLQPVGLVTGLALWIGLCVCAGNLLRGFLAYGALLAGYSASMVVLLSTAHPDQILVLGGDRFLTVFTGVVVALVVGWFLTPASAQDPVVGRIRQLLARTLSNLATSLEDGKGVTSKEQRAILSEMAVLDDALDPHAAGSLRSRRSARTLRALLIAQVPALLWLRNPEGGGGPGTLAIAAAIRQAAQALQASSANAVALQALTRAARLSTPHPALHELISGLQAALHHRSDESERGGSGEQAPHTVVLHRDWVGARHAALRATGLMLLLGAIWLWTGWSGGPFMLLGTSVMISLFSTFDNPAGTMPFVFAGQVAGALAALVCRWLVWPWAHHELELVLLTMPFILLGILVFAHPRTAPGAYDYNFVSLLLLQPALPLVGTLQDSLGNALAVVAAPLLAWVAFRYVFHTNARRRRDILVVMIVDELQDMAGSPYAPQHRSVWRVRLYHRLLRLIRWGDKAGDPALQDVDASLVVLQLSGTALRLRDLLDSSSLTASTARRVDLVLKRIQRIGQAPQHALRALHVLVPHLSREAPEDATLVVQAAEGLAAHIGFFRRAPSRSAWTRNALATRR